MHRATIPKINATLLCALLLAGCAGEGPGKPRTLEETRAQLPAPAAEATEMPGSVLMDSRATLEQSAAKATADAAGAHARMAPSRIVPASPAVAMPGVATAGINRENYAHFEDAAIKRVLDQPVSTFSADVDTAAYANVRRFLLNGHRPPQDAVRVEEMINYFNYDYPAAQQADQPFSVHTEVAPSPWDADTHLLQIGIRAMEVEAEALPPANLVFLIDVSGSMQSADKLPLLKRSMRLLVQRLRPQDRLAIVVYAGASGLALAPTPGDRKADILAALDGLSAGGSTNGGAGIELAYAVARQHARPGGINRVILATDGDFNVGTVDQQALIELVAAQAEQGVALSVLGFGSGNYNDALMESLSNRGNGNAAYIDSLKEANKVLVRQMGATLHTVAKDLKIQVEFNPATVAEYRLIGYENRQLRREDFSNDKVDAGDIGAGHSVTALYEIRLQGRPGSLLEPLRYGGKVTPETATTDDELAYLRLRYKRPDANQSRLLEVAIASASRAPAFEAASAEMRFAAAVAGFGQWLRGGRYLKDFDADAVLSIARAARGADLHGERSEFVQLVELAGALR